LLARGANAGFELVQQIVVVIADGIDQAGDEDVGLGVGFGEEAADEMGGALLFEVAGGETGGIKEGAVDLFAIEEAFAEEAIEGGHNGGVGEAGVEVLGNLLDSGAAQLAENGEHFALATAEERAWRCAPGLRGVKRMRSGRCFVCRHWSGFRGASDDSRKLRWVRRGKLALEPRAARSAIYYLW